MIHQPPALEPVSGTVVGQVRITAATVPDSAAPGLVAVTAAALICIAAWTGRALTGEVGTALLALGILTPPALVAATAFAHHRRPIARDTATVWEFTVRLTGGERLPVTLRTDAPRGALRPRDHVRLIPARQPRRGVVKAVEILATPTGPILHRITALPTLPPVQRAGLLLAALLLAATAATLLTA